MAMYDKAEELRADYNDLFKDGLNFRQLWWVVKICKAVRLYCRSNTAFDNFLNAVFKGKAEFKQVPKQNSVGKEYMGLEIKMINADGTSVTEVMGGTEDSKE